MEPSRTNCLTGTVGISFILSSRTDKSRQCLNWLQGNTIRPKTSGASNY